MMKKILTFILGLFLVIGLTACGSNDKKDVLAHTETFLTACKDGDFAKAEKLCSAEAANTLKITNFKETLMNTFTKSLETSGVKFSDYSETTKKAASDFIDDVLKAIIRSYQMNNDYNGDQKTVSAVVEYLDVNSFSTIQMTTTMRNLVTDYTNAHKSELQAIYTSKGRSEMLKSIIDGVAPDYFKKVKTDYLDKMPAKKQKWIMTLVKKDKTWVIDKITITDNK